MQHQHRRVGVQRPRQPEPLALAAGEVGAPLDEPVAEAAGVRVHHVVRRGRPDRGAQAPLVGPAPGGEVGGHGSLEQRHVVRLDQDGAAQRVDVQVVGGYAVDAYRAPAPVRGHPPGQQRHQRVRVGRVVRQDADDLSRVDAQAHPVQRGVADVVEDEPRPVRAVRPGRAARPGQRLGAEHAPDPGGGGAGHREQLHAVAQRLHRLGDELREPDHGDQLADGEPAAQREPAGDPGDGGEEEAVRGGGEPEVQALGVGGAQRHGEGAPAGLGVPAGGVVLGADAAQHAQAGDEVHGERRGLREGLLLGGAAPGQQRRHPLQRQDQHRYADEHAESERDVDDQQRDRRDGQRAHRGDAEAGHPDHVRGEFGVGGGDREQFAVAQAGAVPARVERALGQLDPQQVRLPLHRRERLAGAVAVGERQHGEQGGEAGDGVRERPRVAGHHGPVDDDADRHRHERLGDLVQPEQGHADQHRAALAAQRLAEHVPGGDGAAGGKRGHEGMPPVL